MSVTSELIDNLEKQNTELLAALKDAINFITLGLNKNPIELKRFLKMKEAVINAEK